VFEIFLSESFKTSSYCVKSPGRSQFGLGSTEDFRRALAMQMNALAENTQHGMKQVLVLSCNPSSHDCSITAYKSLKTEKTEPPSFPSSRHQVLNSEVNFVAISGIAIQKRAGS
jgi:hypothetical protein